MTDPVSGWDVFTPEPRNSTLAAARSPLTKTGPYVLTVAAKTTLDLQAGAVVLFWSKVQASVGMDYNTMYAGFLRLRSGTAVRALTTAEGVNILGHDQHYGIDHHLAVFTAPAAGAYTVEHVVYAASSAYNPANSASEYLGLKYCDQDALVLTRVDDPRLTSLEERVATIEALLGALPS
jgi:hypothetical protein